MVIPCGINFELFYPIDKSEARKELGLEQTKKYVLFTSAFDNPVKNYRLASEVMDSFREAELLEIKNKTREEVNLLLNASDMLLMTSFTEGSPQVIKEAMAVNCPVVSVDVGDVANIFKDAKECYLTSYNPQELKEKVAHILENEVASDGREKISEYDNSVIADQVFRVYNQVVFR